MRGQIIFHRNSCVFLIMIWIVAFVGVALSSNKAEAQDTAMFRQTLFIGKPAAELWQALTLKSIVDKYYLAPLGADIAAAGQDIFYGSEDNKFILGRVQVYRENQVLVHSFRFSHEDPEADTTVTFEIEDIGSMCRLTLTHEGFKGETQTYHDIAGGWPVILSNLKTLLETGEPLPWPKDG